MQQSKVDATAVVRRGSGLYLAASLVSQFSALIRYTTLARILGPEQIGLASVLIITASFFELVTATESERFIILDRDGDTPRMQSLVQLVLSVRGVIVAGLMVVLAWPIAGFYKRPELGPALAILAICPSVAGLLHLDMHRTQRENDFRQEAYAVLVAETLSLIATLIAAVLVRNFTAVLYGLITRTVVSVVASHLQANRPYTIGYSGEYMKRLVAYTIPLMLNGTLVFFGGQADRILVGRTLGLAALGHYSAILLLIAYPASAIQRFVMAMFLPNIAAQQDEPLSNQAAANVLGGQALLLALLMSAGFALVTPSMVVVLYGQKFAQTAQIIAMIGVLQTTRFLIIWPTTIALSLSKSTNILVSNIIRVIALPAGVAGGYLIGGLEGVVLGITVGEFASVTAAAIILNGSRGAPLLYQTDRLVSFALVSATIIAWSIEIQSFRLDVGFALMVISIALLAWIARRESRAIQDGLRILRDALQSRLPFRLGAQE